MITPVLLDGAMGTQLMAHGVDTSRTAPDAPSRLAAAAAVHKAYCSAGSGIVYSDTFSINPFKGGVAAASACVANARAAVPKGVLVGLDMGPLGRMLEPLGDLTEKEAEAAFFVVAQAGKAADLAAVETMTSLDEALCALRGAKRAGLRVFVTLTFAAGGRTIMGDTPEDAVKRLFDEGADAVGMNCSMGPVEALPVASRLLDAAAGRPVIVKPNAGLPDIHGNFAMGPEEFAEKAAALAGLGAAYVGGCCGTSPAHIAALSALLKGRDL